MGRLERQDLAAGTRRPVLTAESGITDAYLSDDNRWVAVLLVRPSGATAIYAVPIDDAPAEAEAEEWITIAEESGYLASPRWSADGRFMYFLSERDGHCCVWAQRLDAETKKPAGEPFAVWHEHRPNHMVTLFPQSGRSIGIGGDKLAFFEVDTTSNIYMLQPGK